MEAGLIKKGNILWVNVNSPQLKCKEGTVKPLKTKPPQLPSGRISGYKIPIVWKSPVDYLRMYQILKAIWQLKCKKACRFWTPAATVAGGWKAIPAF